MAPVIRRAQQDAALFDVRLCVTGQHREMLDQALRFFDLKPDYDLSVMHRDQDLNSLTAKLLTELQPVLRAERPDLVLVQGDTLSAYTGALAAFFEHIPVAHVEAGLRTHNLSSPFPEEALRQMISRLAQYHFAPTRQNLETLLREGVSPDRVFLTGNPGVDAVLWTRDRVRRSRLNPLARFTTADNLARIESASELILVTGHRRENAGSGLDQVCSALADAASKNPGLLVVFPVHPSPRVKSLVHSRLSPIPNIVLLPPVDYPAFVWLMDRSSFIVTDSGGIQEEAPVLAKPVLLTRDTTERGEAVAAGGITLVGCEKSLLIAAVDQLLHSIRSGRGERSGILPFGDGDASGKIVTILQHLALPEMRHSASLQALSAMCRQQNYSFSGSDVTQQESAYPV